MLSMEHLTDSEEQYLLLELQTIRLGLNIHLNIPYPPQTEKSAPLGTGKIAALKQLLTSLASLAMFK